METKNKAVMKKSSLILLSFFLISIFLSGPALNAQDKTKEEKEKEQQIQEAIDAQKKAMNQQKKIQDEAEAAIKDQRAAYDEFFRQSGRMPDSMNLNRAMRTLRNLDQRLTYLKGEPFVFTPGIELYGRGFNGEGDRTTWEFSKYVKESSLSRDYIFDVEPSVNTVVMSVIGDCKSGEIRIKIVMPNGKTYSDILIDESGNLNWRKSFVMSDTENKDKAGAWKFDINSSKATGYFKISLQTY